MSIISISYLSVFTLSSTAFGQAGTEDSWCFNYGNRGGEHMVMEATPGYIYVGGLLEAGNPNLVRFNLATEAFEPLPNIPDDRTGYRAMFYSAEDNLLYVGGNGIVIPANGKLGVFDLTTETWSTLRDTSLPPDEQTGGNPFTGNEQGFIRAIIKYQGKIYVGGSLFGLGVPHGAAIRRFDLATSKWESAGDGFDKLGTVWDLKIGPDGMLYAAGGFVSNGPGTTPLSSLARLNANDVWEDVGGGIDNVVRQLEFTSAGMYCGGDFAMAGTTVCDDVALLKPDGTWDSLGSQNFVSNFGGTNQDGIFSMSLSKENHLYVVGDFDIQLGALRMNHTGFWDGTSWNALANGIGTSDGQIAESSLFIGDDFFVGGNYRIQGILGLVSFARWNANVDFTDFVPGMNDDRSILKWTPEIERVGNQVTIRINGGTRLQTRYNVVTSPDLNSPFVNAGVSQFGEFGEFAPKKEFTLTETGPKKFYRVTAAPN